MTLHYGTERKEPTLASLLSKEKGNDGSLDISGTFEIIPYKYSGFINENKKKKNISVRMSATLATTSTHHIDVWQAPCLGKYF